VSKRKRYLQITDLGIGRVWNPDNSKDISGTPGYVVREYIPTANCKDIERNEEIRSNF